MPMENEYTPAFDDEDNDLFMKHVIGEDEGLLDISRMLDTLYSNYDAE